ncbi:hypothetical protein QAD02_006725 [Eretmocerus hayati]|uniref:Uncharacterized protein n=1 Tax=Eretmocerus hayati TaxID=131215 RepID=A0ACC2N1Q5_9HYME|nr:hypothetical protein QAD02_006725 [Eretmocerus hayati]
MVEEDAEDKRLGINGYLQWKRLQYKKRISWDQVNHKPNTPPPPLDLNLAKSSSLSISEANRKFASRNLKKSNPQSLQKSGLSKRFQAKSEKQVKQSPLTISSKVKQSAKIKIHKDSQQKIISASTSDVSKLENSTTKSKDPRTPCLKNLPTLRVKLSRLNTDEIIACSSSTYMNDRCKDCNWANFINDPVKYQDFLLALSASSSFDEEDIMKALQIVSNLGMSQSAACFLIHKYWSKIKTDLDILLKETVSSSAPSPPLVTSSINTVDEVPSETVLQTELSFTSAAVLASVEHTKETDKECLPQIDQGEQLGTQRIIKLMTTNIEISTKTMECLTKFLKLKNSRRDVIISTVPQTPFGDDMREIKQEHPVIDLTGDDDVKFSSTTNDCHLYHGETTNRDAEPSQHQSRRFSLSSILPVPVHLESWKRHSGLFLDSEAEFE